MKTALLPACPKFLPLKISIVRLYLVLRVKTEEEGAWGPLAPSMGLGAPEEKHRKTPDSIRAFKGHKEENEKPLRLSYVFTLINKYNLIILIYKGKNIGLYGRPGHRGEEAKK
ncbi:MAG: hypothetical protein ACT6RN_27425 [Agrobacterium sp.]|uniref:hypothetical protein n=1 Tax=Agrobacterium sp. TaxID=361 RepID=UPI0040379A0A